MYVCNCNAVTERQIRQAVELGACSLGDLKESLGVATGCGKCASHACSLLRQELAKDRARGYALLQQPSPDDFGLPQGAYAAPRYRKNGTAACYADRPIQENA